MGHIWKIQLKAKLMMILNVLVIHINRYRSFWHGNFALQIEHRVGGYLCITIYVIMLY